MCLGIPGQVVQVVDPAECLASVDVSGVRRTISLRLVADEGVGVGDWVLVHVGFALSVIDAAEAATTLEQIKLLGQPYIDEMDAFVLTEIV
ncbi:MAG: HypC/HybG/HupF family hydrogenase formation chaperone [Bifidobacteriaceae bacterium]|jgi:hydrogenase expression/formation protein HypC|nr:HypC/HybG/HupF family hydrogenase formation chaperone [Bifidobacteriaceae bacterium]